MCRHPPFPLLLLLLLILANSFQSVFASGQLRFQFSIQPAAGGIFQRQHPIQVEICAREFRWQPPPDSSHSDNCKFGRVQLALMASAPVPSSVSLPFSHSWRQSFAFSLRIWQGNGRGGEGGCCQPGGQLNYTVHQLAAGSGWHSRSANFTHEDDKPQAAVVAQLEVRFRVDCAPHFYGPGCDVRCELSDWERRLGRVECAPGDGRKKCAAGWTGPNCAQKVPPSINGNTTISSSSSSNCPCANGGKCAEDGLRCLCPPGYRQPRCEECVTNSRCKGFCKRPGECACPEGKGGQFCEKDLVYCTRHRPCQNGGTCRNSADGDYTCECAPGYRGRDCEEPLTSCEREQEEPCKNGGKCIPHDTGGGFHCECPEGIFGRFCQVRASRNCQGENPCQNGGTCANVGQLAFGLLLLMPTPRHAFKCHCAQPWAGLVCDEQYCATNPCKNGATCLVDSTMPSGQRCICPLGWEGGMCERNVDDCRWGPCLNGGTCVDGHNSFQCRCPAQFRGDLCQDRAAAVPWKSSSLCPECAAPPGSPSSRPPHPASSVLFTILLLLLATIALLALLALLFLLHRLLLFIRPQNAAGHNGGAVIIGHNHRPERPLQISVIPESKWPHNGGGGGEELATAELKEQPRYVMEPRWGAGNFRVGQRANAYLEEERRRRRGGMERRGRQSSSMMESDDGGIYEQIYEQENGAATDERF